MAPIEPDLSNSNLRPLAIFASYLVAASGLTTFITRNVIYRSYKGLPPSQATRLRESKRRKHVYVFLGLAGASLATTWWHMLGFFSLSYRSWAHEMGQPLPERFWGENGAFGEGKTGLTLGRWLSDTELFRDAWEIVIERSQRYWWGQQIFFATAAWALYVSIEGRKRNIRHLWAFMLLAQLVAVSVAMNLFFVAVLLTAVPLAPRSNESESTVTKSKHRRRKSSVSDETALITYSDKAKTTLSAFWTRARPFFPPTKPHHHTWEPHAISLFAPAFVTYVCAFLLPYSTGTTLFMPLLLISHLALFQPLYPQFVLPEAFGNSSPKHYHHYLPRLLAVFSVALHLKQTVASLLDSDPGAYSNRHSKYLAYAHLPHEAEHTTIYRSTSAFGRVLGSLNEHPAVSSVGWDVLMCGISLGVWAAIRGIQPERLLAAIGLASSKHLANKKSSSKKRRRRSSSKPRRGSTSTTATEDQALTAKSTSGSTRRRKKASIDADPFVDDAGKSKPEDPDFKAPPTMEDDEVDFEGEEDTAENAEAAAVGWTLWVVGGLGVSACSVLFAS